MKNPCTHTKPNTEKKHTLVTAVLLLGFHERGPKGPWMKKSSSASQICKLCVTGSPVSVNIYCTSIIYEDVGCLYSRSVRHTTLGQTRSLELFQTGGTDTEAPGETSSASQPQSSTDITSSAATIFCFIDKLKLKTSKVFFVLSALCPFKPMMKDGSFSRVTVLEEKGKKSCTSCWKMWPILIFCGPMGMLAFWLNWLMQSINIFSRISAIPQPRSNTVTVMWEVGKKSTEQRQKHICAKR